MALFKILKGPEKKDAAGKSVMLDPTASGLGIHEGWAYITEEGNFYVDFSENKRLHINAHSITSDFATNDSNGDKICETYIGEIKYMIKSETPYLQYYFGGPDDRIPAAPVAMPVASISSGGVVSTGAQSFKGTKTFTNDIVIQHSTVDNMTQTSTNPFLKFSNSDGSQNVMIMFTDYDTYRSPAGLKILGTTSASPAWLEVEGDFIVGRNTTLNGDLTIKGNLLPVTNNTYTIGSDTYKWKSLYTTTAYINETIYINKSQDGSKGGISLYGTSAPTSYGIAMRSGLGTHGYATDTWNTYFSMTGGDQRGWIFRNENDSAVASINGQGYAQLNKLCLNRKSNKAYGRISWFSSTYKTWHDYMSSNGSGECPSGGTPSSLGAVKTWALRSYIENSNGYGWLWESAAESNTGTPTPRMALSSYDGKLYLSNDLNIIIKDTDKFVHYLYDSTATDYIGGSWRAGVLGSGSDNANYYVIQSGTSTTSPAPTTWNNAVRIGQNEYDFTVGTDTKGSIGIANITSTTGNGISLYGGAAIGKPTYGLFFGGTDSFGKHGGVQGDWATYFTMDSGTNRGWIFLRGDTAVASISNTGVTKVGDGTSATAVDTGALRIAGGLSTTAASYMTGNLTIANGNLQFPNDNIIQWSRNSDLAKIGFKNDSDEDADSYLYFHAADNGNEHFKFRVQSGSTITDIFTLKNAAATFNGTVTATTFVGALNGNASTATKLATARTISLTGAVSGSGSFDGSGNLSIATTSKAITWDSITGKPSSFTASAHNHDSLYLKLSGGTLTGTVSMNANTQLKNADTGSSWILGRDNAGLRMTTSTSGSSFSPVISSKTQLGSWDVGPCHPMENLYFSYATDTNYNAGTNSTTNSIYFSKEGYIYSGRTYGAVWNDYAEYRSQSEDIEPGYCVASSNNGKISKTSYKYQSCDGIVSDTFGFAIGETEDCQTPLAVSGRVLAYCEGNRYDYQAGDTVCAGPNGKVVKMTRKEIQEWPDRIVGTVSEIPEYDTWGSGNVKVNGRIWIKVR